MAMRVMVYSHDTYGLGNIRRMLAVSEHLLDTLPGISVLLVTGSPMVQEFRIRPGLDYIKLPCLSRTGREEYSAKSLSTDIGALIRLRSGIIDTAARDFQPDVLLVDKKPDGIKHELAPALEHLKSRPKRCRIALVLRDILDAPEITAAMWEERGYSAILEEFFQSVLVLGSAEVFDAAVEYRLPAAIREMTEYCGYVRRPVPVGGAEALRNRLLGGRDRLVLVTPGGGEDGFHLLRTYVAGLQWLSGARTVIVSGPEMPAPQRESVRRAVAGNPDVIMTEFTGELIRYMAAADVIVSMAGYNTICEILSLNKRAVTVPRVRPVIEQWLRAERLARLGLVENLSPDSLTPRLLANAVNRQMNAPAPPPVETVIDMDGLRAVARWVRTETSVAEPAELLDRRTVWDPALLTF